MKRGSGVDGCEDDRNLAWRRLVLFFFVFSSWRNEAEGKRPRWYPSDRNFLIIHIENCICLIFNLDSLSEPRSCLIQGFATKRLRRNGGQVLESMGNFGCWMWFAFERRWRWREWWVCLLPVDSTKNRIELRSRGWGCMQAEGRYEYYADSSAFVRG